MHLEAQVRNTRNSQSTAQPVAIARTVAMPMNSASESIVSLLILVVLLIVVLLLSGGSAGG
jgi:hypothetical protein